MKLKVDKSTIPQSIKRKKEKEKIRKKNLKAQTEYENVF